VGAVGEMAYLLRGVLPYKTKEQACIYELQSVLCRDHHATARRREAVTMT